VEIFYQGDEQSFEFHEEEKQGHQDQSQIEEIVEDDVESENLTFEEQLSQLVLNEKV
jgi:flagellar hook-length control protein FliK